MPRKRGQKNKLLKAVCDIIGTTGYKGVACVSFVRRARVICFVKLLDTSQKKIGNKKETPCRQ